MENENELTLAGIRESKRRQLLDNPKIAALKPLTIRAMHLEARDRATTNPAGLLISNLEEADVADVPMTPKLFCRLVNERHVASVNGKPIRTATPSGAQIMGLAGDGNHYSTDWLTMKAKPITLTWEWPDASNPRDQQDGGNRDWGEPTTKPGEIPERLAPK